MKKMVTSKEVRDLLFVLAAIMLSVVVCVTSISNDNMVGIVVSIILLSVLCIGFGYIYCKYEEKLFAICEKNEHNSKNADEKNVSKVSKIDDVADFDIPILLKETIANVSNEQKNNIDKTKQV